MGIKQYISGVITRATRKNPVREHINLTNAPGIDSPFEYREGLTPPGEPEAPRSHHVPLNIQQPESGGKNPANGDDKERKGGGPLEKFAGLAAIAGEPFEGGMEGGVPEFQPRDIPPSFPTPMMQTDLRVVDTFWYPQ